MAASSTDSGASAVVAVAVVVAGAAAALKPGPHVVAVTGAASGEAGRPRLPRGGGGGRVWRQLPESLRGRFFDCAAATAVGRLKQLGV